MKFSAIITIILFCAPHIIQSSESPSIYFRTGIIATESNPITIRPATYHDLNELSDLSQENYQNNFKPLWEKHYATMTPKHHTIESFVQEKANRNDTSNRNVIFGQLQDPSISQKLLVAELTKTQWLKTLSGGIDKIFVNKIVGYCRFEKQDAQTMYINFILVAEEFRKRGIAKQLAQAAMNSFDGVTECKFRALAHYDFINDLYTKHDCQQTGTVSLDPSTGQISTDPNAPITHIDYSYTIKK